MKGVIADTGALVAMLDRRERFHSWAIEQTRTLHPPLLLCEPVLAELLFLLADLPGGREAVRHNLRVGNWLLNFSLKDERERVFSLLEIYADQPMSLADGCIVRMAELNAGSRVFTLDGHFRVYRKNRRQQVPLIMPDEI